MYMIYMNVSLFNKQNFAKMNDAVRYTFIFHVYCSSSVHQYSTTVSGVCKIFSREAFYFYIGCRPWSSLNSAKDLQSLVGESVAQTLAIQWWFPNSFSCAILLNANRAGSTGKQTRLGVQCRSEATVQIFKIVRLPIQGHTASRKEIGDQRWAISLGAADSFITNVSL